MTPTLNLVLDTNTVMALWHFDDPALRPLEQAIAAGSFRLFSRDDALEELRRVLTYAQFGIAVPRQQQLLEDYRARILCTAPPMDDDANLPLCRDRDDQKFLEIARDAGASHLLTRDKLLLKLARHRLLSNRFQILTPERFIADALR